MPFIDGVHSVERISIFADVEINYVRLAVQHLMYDYLNSLSTFDSYYGAAKLIDIFQFGNIYACTGGINDLINSKDMQASCIQYTTKKSRLTK